MSSLNQRRQHNPVAIVSCRKTLLKPLPHLLNRYFFSVFIDLLVIVRYVVTIEVPKPAYSCEVLNEVYPGTERNKLINHSGQIFAFSQRIEVGDWVALPSKHKRAIHIAEVTSDYIYNGNAEDPYYHYRDVKWIATDIPRSNFDQDILYSLGAFMTVCQIQRN